MAASSTIPLLSYVFGALLLLGAAMGGSRGSIASLVAGGVSAAIIVTMEMLQQTASWPRYVQLVVSLVLLAVMGQRFASSGKVMPAGIVAALSLGMAVAYFSRLRDGKVKV